MDHVNGTSRRRLNGGQKRRRKKPQVQTNERTHDSDCVTTEHSFNGDSPEGWDAGTNLHEDTLEA